MSELAELTRRAAACNALIDMISRHGRQLLYSRMFDRNARFDVDRHAQVWYVDEHTGLKLYPFGADRWIGFSHGEVARALVASLAQYIKTGDAVPYVRFEQEWGYGKDMATVQQEAIRLTITRKDA